MNIFRKSVGETQVLLKSDKNNGYLHEDLCTFMIISRSVLLRIRNVSEKVVQKIKTHILCSITFSEYRAVCEIMWKIMIEPDRPQMTM
jgi:hypothetical protein